MDSTARFLDMHVIQSVPYACLNRDDANAVKSFQWGGARRTQVSSQCWKRAMRTYFQDVIGDQALRTRRIGDAVARMLVEDRDWPEELAYRAGLHVTVGSSIKADPPDKDDPSWRTNAMVYVPASAVAELADLAEQHRTAVEKAPAPTKSNKDSVLPKDAIDDVLRSRNGVINLFGRMLAEVSRAGVDGAFQMQHVFTTHDSNVEVDYFSAVDDVTAAWQDSTGSAHMGEAEHSAGVFYRYATIDIQELSRNIGGDAEALKELLAAAAEAFLLSLPEAKKNSTAPNTIPDLVHLVVRDRRPVSYAAAFEKPVARPLDGGNSEPSQKELDAYAHAATRLLGTRGVLAAGWAGTGEHFANLGENLGSFDALIGHALQATVPAEGDSR